MTYYRFLRALPAARAQLRSTHDLHVLRLPRGAPVYRLPVRPADARVPRVRGRVLGVGASAHRRQGAAPAEADGRQFAADAGAVVLRGGGDKIEKAPTVPKDSRRRGQE